MCEPRVFRIGRTEKKKLQGNCIKSCGGLQKKKRFRSASDENFLTFLCAWCIFARFYDARLCLTFLKNYTSRITSRGTSRQESNSSYALYLVSSFSLSLPLPSLSPYTWNTKFLSFGRIRLFFFPDYLSFSLSFSLSLFPFLSLYLSYLFVTNRI